MTILGLETATAVCGAAVIRDGKILREEAVEAKQIHAEKLLALADAALRGSALSVQDLDGIAVSIGPGSFTGLRIGLSAAKGLVFALQKPLMVVPTLEAIALNVVRRERCTEGTTILAVIESRRDEVFAAIYKTAGGWPHEETPPAALSTAVAMQLVTSVKNVIIAGNGAERIRDQLPSFDHENGLPRIPPSENRQCSASAVAMLGALRLERNVVTDAASAEPFYLKEFYTTARPVHIIRQQP